MDRIRDLTDTDGRADELVTSTSGGLFDTQYLSEDPPETHLKPYEQPQYALRNKKSGVSVGNTGSDRTQRPDGDHQALAVVTDCRVLYLVGRASGDHFESVRHDEIVEARAEKSGFMKSVLLVETVDADQFRFACRGDVSAVAAFVDDAAQTWANASRLIDEASDQLEASRESLEAEAFTEARGVLADVSQNVSTARQRVSSVGNGAAKALESRASGLIDRLRQLEQEIAARKGAHHHAAAQNAWKADHDFEQAAEEYERGAAEYERALEAEGAIPSDEALQLRLKGLLKEREVLRVAPMADAKAAREVAMATDDPDEAAAEWETALTCYREAVTLDWGKRERGFVVERDRARERAGEATTEAIDAHIEAGEAWATAGDKIVRNGRERAARQAYERAKDHFQRAGEIARELAPERTGDIADLLDGLEKRQRGEVTPSTDAGETTLSVAAITDQLADSDQHDQLDTPDGRNSTPDEDGESAEAGENRPSDRIDESVDRTPTVQRHTKPDDGGSTERSQREKRAALDSTDSITERETVVEPDAESDRDTAATSGEPSRSVSDEPQTDVGRALRELDEPSLTELVADLWEENGWSTTVFSATTETVYDIVALREGDSDSEDERLLLWTVHRPDNGAVGATVVRRCATTRDSSRGADRATLVTTGTVTSGAHSSADKLGVTVVDSEELASRLAAAGFTDRLV
ncbi:restriction endonuclease [Salinibaculum salinum]|uniref:restriction endonuclease n=1 Tax=Salinibaculum salinum TaxID=3131996 RepID=UPI0030EB5FE0